MATLIAYQDGNFAGTTTWKIASSATGAFLDTTTTSPNTNTTTSYVSSSQFTLTNAETHEGLLLCCKRLTTSGTVTVALSSDGGSTAAREVTVDASDLPTEKSWVFFKFGSTINGDGGSDYTVMVKSSVADNATFYRNSTANNWNRVVRRNTVQNPLGTAAHTFFIADEWTAAGTKTDITVTAEASYTAGNSHTLNIGHGGVYTFSTAAATTISVDLGSTAVVYVFGNGTINVGKSGAPIPRDSTATLRANLGFSVYAGGTFTAYGQSRTSGKNVSWCLLNTDEAAGQTVLGVDTDTGWLSGDQISIAPTETGYADGENRTLSGNADASSMTVTSGLTNAHSGTAPRQAEIGLRTRNVTITGTVTNSGTVDAEWVSINNMGAVSTATPTTTLNYWVGGGSFNGTVTITNSVIASNNAVSLLASTVSWSITDSVFIGVNVSGNPMTAAYNSGTFSNNRIAGFSGPGLSFSQQNAEIVACNNNVIHNCGNSGIVSSGATGTISNTKVWHNNTSGSTTHGGIALNGSSPVILNVTDCDFFGNRNANVVLAAGNASIFKNCTFGGTTTLDSPVGISVVAANDTTFIDCTFRSASGIYTAHSTGDFNAPSINSGGRVVLQNCLLNATTEFANPTNLRGLTSIGSQKHDQTKGSHKAWKPGCLITTDTTIYKTASPSERITPNTTAFKSSSGTKKIAITDATTKTINVWVRKSVTNDGTNYNGAEPRLRYKINAAAGITAEGTLDTMTVANGTWEQLTGTSPAITDDAVLEFYVDCDGTTGWINVDDWSVTA